MMSIHGLRQYTQLTEDHALRQHHLHLVLVHVRRPRALVLGTGQEQLWEIVQLDVDTTFQIEQTPIRGLLQLQQVTEEHVRQGHLLLS